MANKMKEEAIEINEMMSYGIEEEEIPMVFKSMVMNKNWNNMLNLAYAIFADELLYLPDEHVFKIYNEFYENFDFEFHTELLAKEIEDWVECEKCNRETFLHVLELYSKIIYAVNYEIENKIKIIEEEEFSVIYNIYMSMLPYVPAMYLC